MSPDPAENFHILARTFELTRSRSRKATLIIPPSQSIGTPHAERISLETDASLITEKLPTCARLKFQNNLDLCESINFRTGQGYFENITLHRLEV